MLARTLSLGRLAVGLAALIGSCGASASTPRPETSTRFSFWLEDHAASPDCEPAAIRSGLSRHPKLFEAKAPHDAEVTVRIVSCGKREPRSAASHSPEAGAGASGYELDYRVEALAIAGGHERPILGTSRSSWRDAGERLGEALVSQLLRLPSVPHR
jgi:hypothetical protein